MNEHDFSPDDFIKTVFAENVHFLNEPSSGYGSSRKNEFIAQMKARTKAAAVEMINLLEGTPNSPALQTIRFQLLKSATSTAANYRAACRARSKKEFYAKICIVVEECDETIFWMELLIDANVKIDKEEVNHQLPEWPIFMKIFGSAKNSASN